MNRNTMKLNYLADYFRPNQNVPAPFPVPRPPYAPRPVAPGLPVQRPYNPATAVRPYQPALVSRPLPGKALQAPRLAQSLYMNWLQSRTKDIELEPTNGGK